MENDGMEKIIPRNGKQDKIFKITERTKKNKNKNKKGGIFQPNCFQKMENIKKRKKHLIDTTL
jgi:ABC-type dipeptide/oligopeptide/nickel transport system ATPase component